MSEETSTMTDEDLGSKLTQFMQWLRNFLKNGGPEDVVDRLMAAATVATAAVLLVWPEARMPGVLAWFAAVAAEFYSKRGWLGIPV